MEYTVPYQQEVLGDSIPLYNVAESMARLRASGFGVRDIHGPTLENSRNECIALLIDEAVSGRLKVSDTNGIRLKSGELEYISNSPEAFYNVRARIAHLNEWGILNGDSFNFLNFPASCKEHGPMIDGESAFRSYVSDPFRALAEATAKEISSQITDDVGHMTENAKRKKLRLLLNGISGLDPLNMEGEKIDFQALAITSDKDFQVSPSTFSDYLEKVGPLPKLCSFVKGRGRNQNFYRNACLKIGVKVEDYDRVLKDLENQNETAKRKKNR